MQRWSWVRTCGVDWTDVRGSLPKCLGSRSVGGACCKADVGVVGFTAALGGCCRTDAGVVGSTAPLGGAVVERTLALSVLPHPLNRRRLSSFSATSCTRPQGRPHPSDRGGQSRPDHPEPLDECLTGGPAPHNETRRRTASARHSAHPNLCTSCATMVPHTIREVVNGHKQRRIQPG